jgi:hypothetical protein
VTSVSPTPKDTEAEEAKAVLEAAGYVVVKAKSYRDAQERQRRAQCMAEAEVDRRKSVEAWAHRCLDDERQMRDRVTFLYGVARAHGATDDELAADALTQLREVLRWTRDGIPDSETNRHVRADVFRRAHETLGMFAPAVHPASPAVTEGERATEFRSERLRRVITDALEDEGIAGCWCDDSNLDGIAATAAKAAEAWWLSTSLRTKPDFIQALIEADTFDWATATRVTMEELKARLDAIRNPVPASPAVTAAEDEK